MYSVIKRDGVVINFDIAKIAAAIAKAFEAERKIDQEIDALDMWAMTPEEYEQYRTELEERKREISRYRKTLVLDLNGLILTLWRKRNAGAGRSNTSAVSDKMLLTIPTPPTAEAANRSLWQRGMACGMA